MELQLKGQKALVTGSTGGIGRAIAEVLLREGAEVLINGRSEDKVNAVVGELRHKYTGAKVLPAAADLGNEQGCDKMMEQFPGVDILINNMGIFEPAEFFEIPDSEWLRFFEVNVLSGIRLSRHYLQGMLRQNAGRVIFIGSEAAVMPSQEMAHYSATKTMQLSVSRSLAELTGGTKVTVNTVLPGSTLTEGVEKMLQTLYPHENLSPVEAEKRFMKENRPTSILERLIRPEEIAEFVAFLSSPLSAAINGAALRADGGLVRSVF
ncbi:3-oxoacyl-[acyl-carrier-protein] reductase FabG [compost metagenome]